MIYYGRNITKMVTKYHQFEHDQTIFKKCLITNIKFKYLNILNCINLHLKF